jgi:arsenite methyltransferase
MSTRENYGIDAPTVVRNLALIGVPLAVIGLTIGHLAPKENLLWQLHPTIAGTGIGMTLGALWMLASSLWLKQIVRDRLLGERQWRGDEAVLDAGCGRGLVAIDAAKRVPRGHVTGIDLWQAVDLSGNTPEGIRANAQAAGVADRVTVDSGDIRALPYPDASFDVIGSMTVIHNIPDAEGRAQAIREIWRVTRPGGQILIFDIRHARTYARQLRALGASVQVKGPIFLWGPLGWRFSATKP